MNNKKIHEPYNLPTLDDFFERVRKHLHIK